MDNLIKYIDEHTERGECQCGKCFDKGPDREAPEHSVNVHYFWVSARNNPDKDTLLSLLRTEYPSFDSLKAGPSYIEIGAELGDQGLALRLIGLGELVNLWEAVTPGKLKISEPKASELAGLGFVMCSGIPEGKLDGKRKDNV